ncbi:hypothetical protein LTS14_009489 [Recurvomyces mirabilis]|uniref:uncharacterized protein n=1 Tax=Recurvomyces mirabilis TaxID=574656 RepID=UPI002DE04930|nr:hypothetical protein LTS14_009489 [Recurvomyces mirabilis]
MALVWNTDNVLAPIDGKADVKIVSNTLDTSDSPTSSLTRTAHSASTAVIQSNLAPPPDVVARYAFEILPIAQALFPKSALELQEPMTVGKLSRIHLRLLIYALSNNYAGLRPHTPLNILHEYIKEPMTIWLNQTLQPDFRMGSHLSMAPLAEGMFTCAVEAGDVDAVARLLSPTGPGLDVNVHFCNVDGVRYTAIERSAGLQHLALTKLLLKVGADVNKTLNGATLTSGRPRSGYWSAWDTFYSRSSLPKLPKPCGALECAIRGYSKDSQLGHDLVLLLSEARALVGSETMFLMVDIGEDDILEIILSAGLAPSYESWSYAGFFFQFAKRASTPLLDLVLHELVKNKVDLDVALVSEEGDNHAGTCCLWEEAGWPPFWIDILARRGELDLVKLLFESGTSLTPNVLVAATIGRHPCLIAYVLQAGALSSTFSRHYRTTALAEAVRSQDEGIYQLMSRQPDVDVPNTDDQWCALLTAYAEVADDAMLTCLIRQRCHGHANHSSMLGYALVMAARANNLPGAILLLEGGASTSHQEISLAMNNADCKVNHAIDRSQQLTLSPLVSALQCRNIALIEQLLDHGCPLTGSVCAAFAWGDIDMIKTLIASGLPHVLHDYEFKYGILNSALVQAVQTHPECALLTLQAGAILPRGIIRGIIGLADMLLVKEFLEHGSVVIDADALAFALKTSTEVFLIVLEAVSVRSPQDLGILGQHALDIAAHKSQYDMAAILLGRGAAQVPYDWESDAWDSWVGGTCGSALLTAISQRNSRMVEMLLRARPAAANETVGSHRGRRTPLLASLDTCDASMVRALIKYGADINFPATRGINRTPLQRATELGSYDLVFLLLRHGADVNALPAARKGATALQLAASGGSVGIAKLLLEHGAVMTAAGSVVDGRLALEGAAEHGRFDMVVFLLREGQHKVPQMRSAKEYAQEGGYSAVVELLEDAIEKVETDTLASWPGLMEEPYFDNAVVADQEVYEMAEASADDITDNEADDLTQQRHACNICGASLSNASALRRHERSRHRDIVQGRQWACGQCGKTC